MHRITALLIFAVTLIAAAPVIAQTEAMRGDERVDFVEITPAMREAVEKGLVYLAERQADNGSYGGDRYGDHVGITALACMAFMADGNLPGRGRYGEHVQRGLDFIIANTNEAGLIAADTSHGPMYGHGFATLFLGEVYGMTNDQEVRRVLLKAVRLIVNTQNPEGGWRYQPVPLDADISVTICQIMALRSARNAGLSVPKQTIDRAIAYVRNCQNPADGGFRYMIRSGESAFARSAAGVAALYYAGVYNDEAIDRGLDYLSRPGLGSINRGQPHYHYGHYYCAQTMFLAGGQYWANYYPEIRAEMIERQNADGSWESNHGRDYGTSMSLLVLQIPNRLLPIFQR